MLTAAWAASTASSEPSVASSIFAGKSLISTSLSCPGCPGIPCRADGTEPIGAAPVRKLHSYLHATPSKQPGQPGRTARIRCPLRGIHAARWEAVARVGEPISSSGQRGGRVSNGASATHEAVESRIPTRMDRLPWARWHWLVIAALGITWILDGLEVTIVGNIAAVLTDPGSGLGLSEGQVGYAGGIYIAGACTGALFFSYLTDRYGRKKLFLITLAIYLFFTVLTAFSWDFWSFVVFRFLAGTGIGGEYSAIYSAIDELIPARLRGRVALWISGSYWGGAAVGNLLSVVILNAAFLGTFYGWRVAFGLGAILALAVLLLRRYVPESPRWLATHGRNDQAEEVAGNIEEQVKRYDGIDELPPVDEDETITIEQRQSIGFTPIFRAMFQMYPRRTVLGLVLMALRACADRLATFHIY